MNIEKSNLIIDNIIAQLIDLKSSLSSDDKSLTKVQNSDFEKLKNLLNSSSWPEAVDPDLICSTSSENDKEERAIGIIELFISDEIKTKRFLDMGCGEGYCVKQDNFYKAELSVGYDIKEDENWSNFKESDVFLTTDFSKVKEKGPYDMILIFDVLDHLINESPVDFLKKANSVLSPNGKIYIRVHPITSRHATHLYHKLNKAYVHLVFTPDELKELIPESGISNIGENRPIVSYSRYVEQAGLKEVRHDEIREKIEPFFTNNEIIANRIMKHTEFNEFPFFQTELQFLDLVVEKN